jgi:hypothetical protein
MAIMLVNITSLIDFDKTQNASTWSGPASETINMHSEHRSRDDPPSPPPQPPPSPASWNRLPSVRCVTRRHPGLLTLREARRPCAVANLNSGVMMRPIGEFSTLPGLTTTELNLACLGSALVAFFRVMSAPCLSLSDVASILGELFHCLRGVIGVISSSTFHRCRNNSCALWLDCQHSQNTHSC